MLKVLRFKNKNILFPYVDLL